MSRKSVLDATLTAVMAICAVVVTVVLVHREFGPQPAAAATEPQEIKNWSTYAVGEKRFGTSGAPITIVEFSDFQCPFCREFSQTLDRVRAKYPTSIAVVYRNEPITRIHPYARAAAIAAECAAAQGRFGEYHDYLYQNQDSLGKIGWVEVGRRTGIVDTVGFARCLGGSDVLVKLRADSLAAHQLRVSGTPTVLVNRWLIGGAPSDEELEKLITQELARNKTDQ